MSKWIPLFDRLPTRNDADEDGMVRMRLNDGTTRMAQWDWIPPSRPQSLSPRQHPTYSPADWWSANGFVAWLPKESEQVLRQAVTRCGL
jgi:hypothetical protein